MLVSHNVHSKVKCLLFNPLVKSTPTGVTKKATVYAGTCLSGDEATRSQIKESFIKTLQADFLLNILMCSNGVDCQLNNVKVLMTIFKLPCIDMQTPNALPTYDWVIE